MRLKMYPNIKKIDENAIRILDDGRIYVDYGPVSMVLQASRNNDIQTGLCLESTNIIPGLLKEISEAYEKLSLYPQEICLSEFKGLPFEMVKAVKGIEDPTLTPMSAVAGSVSDALADWLFKAGSDKVIVNNGGDIAIRLRQDQSITLGILPDINSGQLGKKIKIRAEDGIGGVCTSGLGGRSLTRGIARSVTVMATRCAVADACATHLANASFIQSEAVKTSLAGKLYPGIDIADLSVVTEVGELSDNEVRRSLNQIEEAVKIQDKLGNLLAVYADVCGYCLELKKN